MSSSDNPPSGKEDKKPTAPPKKARSSFAEFRKSLGGGKKKPESADSGEDEILVIEKSSSKQKLTDPSPIATPTGSKKEILEESKADPVKKEEKQAKGEPSKPEISIKPAIIDKTVKKDLTSSPPQSRLPTAAPKRKESKAEISEDEKEDREEKADFGETVAVKKESIAKQTEDERTKTIKTELKPKIEQPKLEKEAVNEAENLKAKSIPTADPARNDSKSKEKDAPKDQIGPAEVGSPKMKETEPRTKAPSVLLTKSPEGNPEKDVGEGVKSVDQEKAKNPEKEPRKEKSEKELIEVKEPEKPKNEGEDSSSTSKDKSGGGLLSWFGGKSKDKAKDKESEKETDKNKAKDKSEGEGKNKEEDISKSKLPDASPTTKEGGKVETPQTTKLDVSKKTEKEMGIAEKSPLPEPSTPTDSRSHLKSTTSSPRAEMEKINTPSPSEGKHVVGEDEKKSTTPPLSRPSETKGAETPLATSSPGDSGKRDSPRNIEAKSKDSPKTSNKEANVNDATSIPAANPEPIKKKGFIQNLFDNSSLFNVMSKRPVHPSKTKDPEKVQSAAATEKYRRTTAVDHATAIQAAWRGKKARKWLKIRHLASISIQRIYRGVLERKKTLPSLSIKREKIIIKQEQKQRMRDINRKEKDLKLLSQLPPDEYLQYENVRKQSAAKVIQTAWRQSNRNPLNYKFQERLSYSTKKKYPIKSAKFFPFRTSKDYPKGKFKRDQEDDGEEEMKGEEAKKSLEAMRLEKIVTASFRKKSGVAGGAEYLEQIYEPRNMIDYSMDENVISLSMLYQRIRAQASDRMTKKAEEKRRSGYSQANAGVIGGMRQRYGELLEAQQKADIILEEYLMDKTYLDYRKTERRKSLCTINELVDLIKHPLSLDEAADIINDSKGRLSMDEKRRNYAEGWLYDFDAEYVKANLTSSASVADSNKNPKKSNSPTKEKKEGMSIQTEFAQSFEEKRKAKIFDLAMESHLTGADTMVNSSRWDAVFVPAILTDHTIEDEIAMQLNAQALAGGEGKDTNKLTSSISMPKIKKLTKSESLKHLAKKWSTGEEVGDSLYWVTYATQPSKLLSEVNPDADITELIRKQASNENYQKILKEFHSSYFNPKQRLEKAFNTIEKENNRIQRLAKTIEKQTWKEIRLKFSDDFKELSAKEKAEKRMKSIIYVQSIMRGYLTRRRYQKLKQQQRFYHAVQHLLNEMELLQYEQNHPHHTPPTGNKTVPSLAANFLPRPSGGPKGALLSSVEVQQQQMISEIARITSSALKTPFQLPLPSNANSSSAKTRPATTTVLPPLADRGLNPPTMTQSIDYSSSNATTPLRHLMSKSATLGAVGTSSTSITPAKFDQVTKRTPYPENLNLPPHQIPASVTNTPHQQRLNEISQNYNQNDRVYSLRKVDEPVNVQLSARSGSIGGGGTGALGFETPLLQTPRGQFTVHKGETGGSGSKNNEMPPSLKLPRDTPRPQSQQITPRDAIINPNTTAPSLTPMRPQNNPNDANQPPKSHRKQTPPTGNNAVAAAKHNTSNNSSEEISSSLNYTTTMTSTPLKQDQSTFLSPFLEMDGDEERRSGKVGDDDDGYISSPSQTSLSRSLSVSFGQVTNQPNSVSPRAELISSFANPSNKGSGKVVAFASSASSKKVNSIMKSRFPYIPDPLLGLLVNIERHYIQNQCNVNDIVDSALVADIGSFDKKAAIDFTVALLKKYPGKALITWLSEIPIEKAITANEGERSTKNIELTVEIVAITLAELSLYDPNTMKMASSISEKEIHNITQFTLLMRLFGAGTDSGNIRVLDLNTWFMELFILVISRENIQHRMDSSKLLAKLRCYLSKEAAKKGTTNFTVLQEYLDDIVPDYLHEGSDRGSVSGSGRKPKLHETEVSLDLIQELFSFLYQQYLAYYTNKGINPMTPAGLMTPSSAASPARHMVRTPERNVQQIQMLIQILSEYHYAHLTPPLAQSLAITTISLKEIQEILCALPTHRQLQRKIQTWFRAVPESFTTIINGLNINANSISQSMIHQEIFINILAQSLLPTNHSENRLFADILQRRSDNSNNQQTPNRKGANPASEMLVDIRLLNRVKNGEFLQAPL